VLNIEINTARESKYISGKYQVLMQQARHSFLQEKKRYCDWKSSTKNNAPSINRPVITKDLTSNCSHLLLNAVLLDACHTPLSINISHPLGPQQQPATRCCCRWMDGHCIITQTQPHSVRAVLIKKGF